MKWKAVLIVVTLFVMGFTIAVSGCAGDSKQTPTPGAIVPVEDNSTKPGGNDTGPVTNLTGGGYIQLSITNAYSTGTLTDFPACVHLSSDSGVNGADLTDVFNSLGNDSNRFKIAVFTPGNMTQCYVEIEKWDTVQQEAVLWVKVPSISPREPTELYLFYDATGTNNTDYVGDAGSGAAEQVWDEDFLFVNHMNTVTRGEADEWTDSTQYDNDGHAGYGKGGVDAASHAPGVSADGLIGDCEHLDGVDDYLVIDDRDSLSVSEYPGSGMTFSWWLAPHDLDMNEKGSNTYTRYAGKGMPYEYQFVYYNNAHSSRSQWFSLYVHHQWATINESNLGAGDYADARLGLNEWIYITGKIWYWDASTGTESIYIDLPAAYGRANAWNESAYHVQYTASTADFCLGTEYFGRDEWWDGLIDEVRISKTIRDDNWCRMSYYSDRDMLITYVPGQAKI